MGLQVQYQYILLLSLSLLFQLIPPIEDFVLSP